MPGEFEEAGNVVGEESRIKTECLVQVILIGNGRLRRRERVSV